MARVVCCQVAPRVGDLAHNLALVERTLRAAGRAGGELVVLPELVTSGYCFASAAEARASALPASSPVFDGWAALLPDAVVVAGFAELGEDDSVYNSAVVLAGGGRTVYRKTHLWDREQLFFTPGAQPPPVVDTRLGRVGVMVCYDLEFAEMPRSVALRGADVLAVPTNWPWVDRPSGQPAPEVVIAMAAARTNHLPIACADRTGVERGQAWNEATTVLSADGWPVGVPDEDGLLVADVDLARTADKRVSPRNDLLADRRPELYP